ncbi:MAG: ABC transporter permease [Verrucomicrobia bacterium]|nr:ABC transporter permease [Verrucomicrobiota bacterium]
MANTVTVISAERHERLRQFLKDLWDYRELFLTFVQRDLKVRYKQTVLGVAWVILQPLFMVGAFSLIFGKIAKMPTDGLPYAIFYIAALVPWNTFAHALSQSAMSMESNAHLISKVYFPRLVVPGGIICGSFVDFAIGFTVMNALAIYLGHWDWRLLPLTPFLLAIQALTALGIGLALAILNAQYRDVKHAVGFMVQLFMLATPVIYPASRLPQWAQDWLFLNPMAVVVTTYRSILKGDPLDWLMLLLALTTSLCYLAFGIWFFRKREARLADVL